MCDDRRRREKEMKELVKDIPGGETIFWERVEELYKQRIDKGLSDIASSRNAITIAHEELLNSAELESVPLDQDHRFECKTIHELEKTSLVDDFRWVVNAFGCDRVMRHKAPSGNAWNMYKMGKEDADWMKKVYDWAMRCIPATPSSERVVVESPVNEEVDAESLLPKGAE